ncbi:prepilin-type N-terminal cleavage/methylation domain-containing protein [Parahaliea sp. F7430]|uniref:Prepilin-type N-terminal cleavage/methylation domain-containing protein n=1 Tax=Sediminihaliea albiluteola TaxID=2758564 RepID=A0A7W2TYU5_9GAMM|nr:prepilin-type N-terminal cleavage/methylation domain-containing protein [Sediminihaliea albiluteola]MBA6414269.1 prepilin-type N-terminal cleavage/methylation domain-containing protein [Sediminihaliea albiluteola]
MRKRVPSLPKDTSRGFTLVEVVVALAVLSLIMLATVSALRTFANTQTSLDRVIERIDETRTVSSFLRSLVASAAQGQYEGGLTLGGPPENSSFFFADESFMTWKATVLFGENFGGTYLLRVQRQGDALVLLWQEPSNDNSNVDWSDAASRQLISGLQEFSLAFRPNFVDDWVTKWEPGAPPALVRLRIKTRDRYWPDLVMELPW